MSDIGMRDAFDRQHQASRTGELPDAVARRALLSTLGDLILANRGAFADAISHDFGGRSKAETELLEIVPAVRGIRHARKSHAG